LKPGAKFRDDDHKFEWTRAEFEEWCQINADLYGYAVEYSGVGVAPKPEDRSLGYCTQFATFVKNKPCLEIINAKFTNHNLVSNYEFPHFTQKVTDTERIQCITNYAKYIPPVEFINSSKEEEWPVFNVGDFWKMLKIRQYFTNFHQRASMRLIF